MTQTHIGFLEPQYRIIPDHIYKNNDAQSAKKPCDQFNPQADIIQYQLIGNQPQRIDQNTLINPGFQK